MCNLTSPITTRNDKIQVPSPIQANTNTFLCRSERIQEKSVPRNSLIITYSPPFQIPSLATTLYEDPPQASSLVLNFQSTTSYQPIQSPQKSPITLPLIPFNKTGSMSPKNPSRLTHQISPTQTLSLAS
ncbi:hypothetical protein O181_128183 [Austropuccinia psidii MF-1]|uniref:Uncharacterized protein n=1 Tax=Austropuccinia psidii MF-1 TaxID=1389203 RepID=A0A9Q3Q7M7_9BASI|nr:hypothetical protein [Austropuccinia psidii MF-1]